jgi:hypothetical protein
MWSIACGALSAHANMCSVSVKGSSIRWLETALIRGDLLTAWTVAFELPRLPLDHALALVVLTAADEDRPARFDAAARRWAALYLTAAADPTLTELRAFVDCLDELPDLAAVTTLGALCERRALPLAAAALDHLTPRDLSPPPSTLPRLRR